MASWANLLLSSRSQRKHLSTITTNEGAIVSLTIDPGVTAFVAKVKVVCQSLPMTWIWLTTKMTLLLQANSKSMVHTRNSLLRALTPSRINSVNSFRSCSKTWRCSIKITSSWNRDRLLKRSRNNKLQPLNRNRVRLIDPKVLIVRAKDQLLELTNSVAATVRLRTKAISQAGKCDRRIKT